MDPVTPPPSISLNDGAAEALQRTAHFLNEQIWFTAAAFTCNMAIIKVEIKGVPWWVQMTICVLFSLLAAHLVLTRTLANALQGGGAKVWGLEQFKIDDKIQAMPIHGRRWALTKWEVAQYFRLIPFIAAELGGSLFFLFIILSSAVLASWSLIESAFSHPRMIVLT